MNDDSPDSTSDATRDVADLEPPNARASDIRELGAHRLENEGLEEEGLEDEDDVEGDDSDATPLGPSKVHPEEVDEVRLKDVLESLVFVADQPVSAVRLGKLARTKVAHVRRILGELIDEYENHGLQLIEVGGGYQFRSAPRNAEFVRGLVAQRPVRLTRAQLETLSIVAYRQPVTRPEIDEIRGVDSGSALKVLVERNLLKLLGRKEEPGRPLLYGTTPQFLEFFGLSGLRDLPTLREFSELNEESRALFERRMGEPLDLAADAESNGTGEVETSSASDEEAGELLADDGVSNGDVDDVEPDDDDWNADAKDERDDEEEE